ncbi:class I lanthipeptide [Kordia algicida OT-1]|uniref:Uncharacterized protein n=1 Tax=Kordia algicida OT-1 TaxID=391587 RepID=A9DLA0_9FLAO|nr:class I lanthipeptide [Kordia algicida]EDP98516.1 hypothetical protein KAOT1_14902 [Kordia algicida OT-1]
MKKSLKKLQINKQVVTNLDAEKVNEIKGGLTAMMCNTVPEWDGGIGCHLW